MELLTLAAAVLLLLGLLALAKTIVEAHSSPLSAIPNAGWGAAYSRLLWAFPREYQGTITLDLPRLHRRLGPLIRVGPGEVSFYSMEGYNTVHKVNGGFVKDPRNYGQFVQDGHPALFSITHPEEHAKRRRIMGQLFNRSKIQNLEALMLGHIREFVAALERKRGPLDAGSACRALEADIMSDFSFGKPLGALEAWESGADMSMVAKNDEKATWMPLLMNFPVLYEAWMSFDRFANLANGSKASHREGLRRFDQWAHDAWSENFNPQRPVKPSSPNLIRVMVSSGLARETALSEAKENLGPGTDTTSASLAHIVFALSRNPLYQEELYADLARAGFSTDMSTLEGIPRLKALVKEGIRWAGAAVAMLPRIVPAGGVELHGKFIPQGTVVTSSPVWYLRDEGAFPEPELFDPYRWIDEHGAAFDDALRDRFYIPFSKGANICMGMHFSYYELYLSLSELLRRLRVLAADDGRSATLTSDEAHHGWHPVRLPGRKEWVAAVLTDGLFIKTVARGQV